MSLLNFVKNWRSFPEWRHPPETKNFGAFPKGYNFPASSVPNVKMVYSILKLTVLFSKDHKYSLYDPSEKDLLLKDSPDLTLMDLQRRSYSSPKCESSFRAACDRSSKKLQVRWSVSRKVADIPFICRRSPEVPLCWQYWCQTRSKTWALRCQSIVL